jgi:hypothetical protein
MAESDWQPEHIRIKQFEIQKLLEKEPLGLSTFEKQTLDEWRANERKKEQKY